MLSTSDTSLENKINHSTKAYPIQAVTTMNEIVLTDEQYNTIGRFYNSTAGHAGIDRTVK